MLFHVQDLTVKSSWRHRHAAMTPLFSSTLATQTDMDDDESMSVNIRATQQDAQFSATQDGESTCSSVVVKSFGMKFCGLTENDVFIGC